MRLYEIRTTSAAVFQIQAESIDWDTGQFWNSESPNGSIIGFVNLDHVEYIQDKGEV